MIKEIGEEGERDEMGNDTAKEREWRVKERDRGRGTD